MGESADLAVIKDVPSQDLIERLEGLLAEAKTGELQALVYVCSWRANSIGSGWCGLSRNRMRIMGELFQLLHKLANLE